METYGVIGLFKTDDDKLQYQHIRSLATILNTYTKSKLYDIVLSLYEKDGIQEIRRIVYYPMERFDEIAKKQLSTAELLKLTQMGMFSFTDDYFQINQFDNNIHSIRQIDYNELLEEYIEWIASIILNNNCQNTLSDTNLLNHKNRILQSK